MHKTRHTDSTCAWGEEREEGPPHAPLFTCSGVDQSEAFVANGDKDAAARRGDPSVDSRLTAKPRPIVLLTLPTAIPGVHQVTRDISPQQ